MSGVSPDYVRTILSNQVSPSFTGTLLGHKGDIPAGLLPAPAGLILPGIVVSHLLKLYWIRETWAHLTWMRKLDYCRSSCTLSNLCPLFPLAKVVFL